MYALFWAFVVLESIDAYITKVIDDFFGETQ